MTDVGTVVTALFNTVGSVVDAVEAHQIMLIGIAATVGGIAITWFKRLTGQRSGKRR